MAWETILAKLGLDLTKGGLKVIRSRVSKRSYKALLARAVAELLKLDPDIASAEADILAAEVIGQPPSSDLLKAREILAKVKSHSIRAGKKAMRPKAKKAAKRRACGKKTTKKKKTNVSKKRVAKRKTKRQ